MPSRLLESRAPSPVTAELTRMDQEAQGWGKERGDEAIRSLGVDLRRDREDER
jgi:hypothetical protein